MKIAIQGIEGSFHAIAARRLFGDQIKLVFCKTFKAVFESLQSKESDRAVVAIENSLYGSINDVYDLLLNYKFSICAEAYEQISLHLLTKEAMSVGQITDIYSQAPALAEAAIFLDNNTPLARRHEYTDTALAAQYVASQDNLSKAAIASRGAANIYGLHIVAENIETHHANYTRFLAIDPTNQAYAPNANKTSITFRTADKPGSLHAALGIFAKRQINLSKLESRPIVGKAWQYMYYVDFNAPFESSIAEDLASHASNIRILGSYPSGNLEHIE